MPRKKLDPEPADVLDSPSVNTTDMMQYLDRVERLEEEIKAIQDDKRDIWTEAKAAGYDTKNLRKAHALRKLDREDRVQELKREVNGLCRRIGEPRRYLSLEADSPWIAAAVQAGIAAANAHGVPVATLEGIGEEVLALAKELAAGLSAPAPGVPATPPPAAA